MALKRKIDKKAFDKLSKDLQAEYVEKDGEYVLDVDGGNDDDNGALRRAKDRAVQERKDEKKRADAAEAKLADLDDNDARKTGDIEKLDKSWKDKLDAQTVESAKTIAAKDKFISSTLVDSVASAIAAEITTTPGNAKILLPHIRARLAADLDGDTPATKVLGADGKVSATTVDELKKEFVDNKDYASIIVASKANGGGAPDKGQQRPGGASQTETGDKPPMLSNLSGKDLAAQLKANKEAEAD
jgi:hypothetical protein